MSNRSAWEAARRVLAGGVNSPVRAFRAVGGDPVFIARGDGAWVEDVEGNRYVDYVLSWGPLILGHAPPGVVEAVTAAARDGTSFGAPTERETRLAEIVVRLVPSIEAVRFVSSGTEACMAAARLARGAPWKTARSKILKFAGCYHGHFDSFLVAAGSGAATFGVPDSAGVPPAFAGETLVARFNDLASVEAHLAAHGGEIAAVFAEPVVGNMGVVPPAPGFLEGLRRLCDAHGALLVLDEVMTGFRLALGGAQALYGVRPDLTCLGKVIGGGLPVAAYGGRRDLMDRLAPDGPVYQAGTLSGNPLAMAAGIATLEALERGRPYDRLEALGAALEAGYLDAARAAGVPLVVQRVGSMITPFFLSTPVRISDWDAADRCDRAAYGRFHRAMRRRGVLLPPSQFEAHFLSAAHGEAEIGKTIEAAREALAEVAAGA